MPKLPIFEHFFSVRNLKLELKWFFKLKLKSNLLNWAPVAQEEEGVDGRHVLGPCDGHEQKLVGAILALHPPHRRRRETERESEREAGPPLGKNERERERQKFAIFVGTMAENFSSN